MDKALKYIIFYPLHIPNSNLGRTSKKWLNLLLKLTNYDMIIRKYIIFTEDLNLSDNQILHIYLAEKSEYGRSISFTN